MGRHRRPFAPEAAPTQPEMDHAVLVIADALREPGIPVPVATVRDAALRDRVRPVTWRLALEWMRARGHLVDVVPGVWCGGPFVADVAKGLVRP